MISWSKFFKKIPNQVKVGKNNYEIVWINEFTRFDDQFGESRFGEEKQIVLNLNQTKKESVHTLWHEILHALSFEYEADLTEKQVQALEKGLKDLIGIGKIFTEGNRSEAHKRMRRNLK